MTADVVWFDSQEAGAPVLNNAAGSLIGVLDACLVTGFNTKTITSLVVAGNVATATCNGHGFSGKYSQDVLISGATPAGLNGRKQPTVVDANTFTFDATGVSNQTATGTITAKRAPAGWNKLFAGTNKVVYKRSDAQATAMLLRVDDPAGIEARALMVETATDVDTYTGPSPTEAQVSGGQFWGKGQNNTSPKQWVVVANSKFVFIVTNIDAQIYPLATPYSESTQLQAFGDFASFKPGDAYNCLIAGAYYSPVPNNGVQIGLGGSNPNTTTTMMVARGYSQLGSAMPSATMGIGNQYSGSQGNLPVFPSPIDSGMVMMPGMLILEDNSPLGYPFRGICPGMLQILARRPLGHTTIIDPVVALPGRKVLMLSVSGGQIGVDLTGPW
jgi:hypothetical protein